MIDPEFTEAETAVMHDVTECTLWRWTSVGLLNPAKQRIKLPFHRRGMKRYFLQSDLNWFFDQMGQPRSIPAPKVEPATMEVSR